MNTDLFWGLLIPILFWAFDTLVKVYGSIPTDDVGADLCLFAISFIVTTIFVSLITPSIKVGRENYAMVAALTLIVSLIFYIFTLTIIAPGRRNSYPNFIQMIRKNPNKKPITIAIGFGIVFLQTFIYIVSFWV